MDKYTKHNDKSANQSDNDQKYDQLKLLSAKYVSDEQTRINSDVLIENYKIKIA